MALLERDMRDLVHLMVQIKRLCINVKIGIDVTPVWVSGGCGRPFIINAHMCAVCYRVGMSEQKCCIHCCLCTTKEAYLELY